MKKQLKEWLLPELEKVKSLGNKKEFRVAICNYVGTGDWVEFGVREGDSAKIFLKYGVKNGANLYLFDSWEGLPEDWTGHYDKNGLIKKGAMKCDIPVFNDNRVKIVKGWFDDTLPNWVANYNKPLALIHIDSDIYSSAVTILNNIKPLISDETIIVFDEFAGYAAFRDHEYKAFLEFIDKNEMKYKYVARSKTMAQVALKVYK